MKNYIHILLLSMATLGTMADSFIMDTSFGIECKIDLDKETDKSEKEEVEKKDAKYYKSWHLAGIKVFLSHKSNFTYVLPSQDFITSDVEIPPEK